MPATHAPPRTTVSVGDLEGLFKGFADPTRIRILNLLAAGELCVCDLVALLRLSQPTVSRHLAYLRRSGLVVARPDLKFTYYRLADPSNLAHRHLLAAVRSSFHGVVALERERDAAEARVAERRSHPCR
jgi:ArsR family transcriptional regulator, arsenate/arsenite/antimonite-responsive transcriptional repressor